MPVIDPRALDELTRKLSSMLPPGAESLRTELRESLRAAVSATLSRMDVVSREEFDVQSAVLARTREKVTELERVVERLERELAGQEDRSGSPDAAGDTLPTRD